LKNIIAYALRDPEITYVPAPREDVAVGIASGACLCGQSGGILIQNSGLGNIINPLTSFNLIYRIPVFMVISWRGYEGKDAPEHLVMGEKTPALLDELGIPFAVLDDNSFADSLGNLLGVMREKETPVALVLRKEI